MTHMAPLRPPLSLLMLHGDPQPWDRKGGRSLLLHREEVAVQAAASSQLCPSGCVSAAREQVLVLALLSHALLGSFAADIQLGNGPGHLHHAVTQPDESLLQHVAGQQGKRSRLSRWPGLGTSACPALWCRRWGYSTLAPGPGSPPHQAAAVGTIPSSLHRWEGCGWAPAPEVLLLCSPSQGQLTPAHTGG